MKDSAGDIAKRGLSKTPLLKESIWDVVPIVALYILHGQVSNYRCSSCFPRVLCSKLALVHRLRRSGQEEWQAKDKWMVVFLELQSLLLE